MVKLDSYLHWGMDPAGLESSLELFKALGNSLAETDGGGTSGQ